MVTLFERIKQLRSQMLIHSYIYYVLNDNLISDHEWQRRADELVTLQQQLFMPIGWYDAEFAGWDGSTGCHLPLGDLWVVGKAAYLMGICREKESN